MSINSTADLSDLDSVLFYEVTPPDLAADDSEATTPTYPLYSTKPTRGREITAKDVQAQARDLLAQESKRNEHSYQVWYYKRYTYKGTVTNSGKYLRLYYSIDLRKSTLLQQAVNQSSATSTAFTTQQKLSQAQADLNAEAVWIATYDMLSLIHI